MSFNNQLKLMKLIDSQSLEITIHLKHLKKSVIKNKKAINNTEEKSKKEEEFSL